MQSEGSVVIDRPIEEVFRIARECIAEWSEIVVEDRVIEDKNNGGVGTRFHTVTASNGQRMEFDGIVTHHDPPYSTASRLTGQHFDIEVAQSFEPVGSHTKVTQWSKVHGKGWLGLMLRLTGWMMTKANCEATVKELNRLKNYCEQSVSSDAM